MKMRPRTLLAVAATTIVLLPLGVVATTASWNDAEWTHSSTVGTGTVACGTDTGYSAASSGRFLSGQLLTGVLPVDLDSVAALRPVALGVSAAGGLTVSPSSAINLGSTPPVHTYANPLNVSLLGGIAGLNLTGLTTGLPIGSAGALNQYGQVSAHGTAAGAAGLVSNSGGVLVTASTPPSQLPQPATIALSGLLPAASGIADVALQVGAVAASSRLDGCAALRSAIWGDGAVTGVVRDYGIAGLGLQINSPAIAGLVGTVNSGVSTIGTAVSALTGTSGLISQAIGTRIDLALPGVLTTSAGGTVSITGLNLTGAVSSLLSTALTDGIVTINLQSGIISVDLDALLPSLNNAPANTEVVINPAVLAPIVTRVGTLLNNWSAQIVSALRQAVRNATLTIDVSVVVRTPGVAILAPQGLDILRTEVDYVGSVGAVLDGTAALTVHADAVGAAGLVSSVLTALGLPTITELLSIVNGLTAAVLTAVANVINTTVMAAITTLGTTLSTLINAVIAALSIVVAALPSVLSLRVNVQPDMPGAPPGMSFIAATDSSTPQYVVAALRLGLANFLTPAAIAHVQFATATAGPVTAPQR